MKTDEINNKLYKKKEKPQRKIDWGLSVMTFIENHVITFMLYAAILGVVIFFIHSARRFLQCAKYD